MSRFLLNPSVANGMDGYLHWYQKLKPCFERYSMKKEGLTVTKALRAAVRDIHLQEKNPLPSFPIRQSEISA